MINVVIMQPSKKWPGWSVTMTHVTIKWLWFLISSTCPMLTLEPLTLHKEEYLNTHYLNADREINTEREMYI